MDVMKKVEKQKLQRLICQSLRSLCEAGLPDSTNISIEGLIGITVNSEYVILVGVHEEIGDGEVEMIECHGEAGRGVAGGGKGMYLQNLQAKMFHQTHAAMLRQHMMQAMQAGMAVAQGVSAPHGMPAPEKPLRQYSKATQPHDKVDFSYSHFEGSDEDEITSGNQTFTMASTPSKTIPAATQEEKDTFPFANYEPSVYAENPDKSEREETRVSGSHDTVPKPALPDKPLSVSEQVQASTICITPVVESPKQDECGSTNTKPPQSTVSPLTAADMVNITDYGRKLGTLTAVKQEGAAGRRRGSKSHHLHPQGETNVQIEEISDSDNNTTPGDGEDERIMRVCMTSTVQMCTFN